MQLATANSASAAGQAEIPAVVIKKKILEQGSSISEIARQLGYARNTVSLAIHHPSLFPAVRERVIEHLNLELAA